MDSINPTCQRLRPLAEYTERLPSSRKGKRLNRATLWRWALHGVQGGRRLRTVVLGAGRMSCDAWVWQFVAHTPAESQSRPVVGVLDAAERERIARELRASTDRRSA